MKGGTRAGHNSAVQGPEFRYVRKIYLNNNILNVTRVSQLRLAVDFYQGRCSMTNQSSPDYSLT